MFSHPEADIGKGESLGSLLLIALPLHTCVVLLAEITTVSLGVTGCGTFRHLSAREHTYTRAHTRAYNFKDEKTVPTF